MDENFELCLRTSCAGFFRFCSAIRPGAMHTGIVTFCGTEFLSYGCLARAGSVHHGGSRWVGQVIISYRGRAV